MLAVTAALIGADAVFTGVPAWAAHGSHGAVRQGAWVTTAVRSVTLPAIAAVAGSGLLRPLMGAVAPRTSIAVSVAAAVTAGGALVVSRPVVAVFLVVPALTVAVSRERPRSAFVCGAALTAELAAITAHGDVVRVVAAVGAAAWLGAAVTVATAGTASAIRRIAAWEFAATACAVAEVLQAGSIAAPLAAVTVGAAALGPFVLGPLALGPARPTVRRWARSVAGWRAGRAAGAPTGSTGGWRAGAVAAVGAVCASAVLLVVPPPRPGTPGRPLLRDVAGASVLLVPNRPGWNLVHVADGAAVGTDRARLHPTTPRPGASGTWALVRLPPGRSDVWVRHGDRVARLPVNTGRSAPAPDVTGADGPECANAALGELAARAELPMRTCPADRLDPADAAALRDTVRFIAGRGWDSVTVVGDSSPRSQAAVQVVRAASASEHLTVTDRPRGRQPVIVVAGWSAADAALRAVAGGRLPAGGAYLAPWLLSSPLLSIPAGQVLSLRYSPRDRVPLRYAAALAERFAGALPTAVGYAAWLAARRTAASGPVRMYATSLVSWLPAELAADHDHGGTTWLPGGTITAVSGPLGGR